MFRPHLACSSGYVGVIGICITILLLITRWIQFSLHFENVPGFQDGDEETLEAKLWETLAKSGLLVAPGWFFASTDEIVDAGEGHFRVSFSNAEVRSASLI